MKKCKGIGLQRWNSNVQEFVFQNIHENVSSPCFGSHFFCAGSSPIPRSPQCIFHIMNWLTQRARPGGSMWWVQTPSNRFEDGGSAVSGARKNCRKPMETLQVAGVKNPWFMMVYGLTSWFSRLKFLCDFRPPGTSQLLPWMTWW